MCGVSEGRRDSVCVIEREGKKRLTFCLFVTSFEGKIEYYRIQQNDYDWVSVDGEEHFENLVELVEVEREREREREREFCLPPPSIIKRMLMVFVASSDTAWTRLALTTLVLTSKSSKEVSL